MKRWSLILLLLFVYTAVFSVTDNEINSTLLKKTTTLRIICDYSDSIKILDCICFNQIKRC